MGFPPVGVVDHTTNIAESRVYTTKAMADFAVGLLKTTYDVNFDIFRVTAELIKHSNGVNWVRDGF